MAQLVGQDCTICQQRITCDLDGGFCRECGSAVHSECVTVALASSDLAGCRSCGSTRRAAAAARAKEEEKREACIRQLPPPPPSDLRQVTQWYWVANLLFSAFGAMFLGCFLLASPIMRQDPQRLSGGEIAAGVAAFLVGLLLLVLGIMSARRK